MIHRLKSDDSQNILSNLYRLYVDFFTEQRSFSDRYQFEYSEEDFINHLKEETGSQEVYFYYLSIDDSIVGFLRGRKKKETKSFILHDLYIKPEYRGGGFGEKLFLALKNDLDKEEISNIDILVDVNNKAGITFWEKMGFSIWQQKMSYKL